MRSTLEEDQTICSTSNELRLADNSTQHQKSAPHGAPAAVPEWLIPISPTANLNTACNECQDRMLRAASAGIIDFFTIEEESNCTLCCMLRAKADIMGIWSCIDMRQMPEEDTIRVKRFTVAVQNGLRGMRSQYAIVPPQDDVAHLSIHSKDQEAVHPWKINFGNLKAKLSCCLANHGAHCNTKEKSSIQGLQVINCKTRMIELAEDDTEYVSLSYVWGKYGASKNAATLNEADTFAQRQPTNTTTFPRELPRKLELTIEDAIRVTLEMGFSFLWVDKYCIDESNPVEKNRHIRNMDSIYHSAAFTIIAAAGDDADHGLPGVSTRPRTSRTSCRVGNFLVLSGALHNGTETEYRPNQSDVLAQSTWNSRAWTYQEGLLSRRCLVFTDEQASFACRLTLVADGAETRPTAPKFSLEKQLHSGFLWREIAAVGIGSRPAEIASRIYEYSQRQLTRADDILNAFSGILRAFEKMDPPTYHLWGVPILSGTRGSDGGSRRPADVNRPLCDGFLRGLLWKADSPCVRRAGFPSWSWAGFSATKVVLFGLNLEVNLEDKGTDGESVRLYVELMDETIRSWAETEKRRYLKYVPCPPSRFLWLDAWTIQIKIRVQKAKANAASFGAVDRLFASYVDDSSRGVEVEGYDGDFLDFVKSQARKQRIFTSVILGSLSWSVLYAIVVWKVEGIAERAGIFRVDKLWYNEKIPMERLERQLTRLG